MVEKVEEKVQVAKDLISLVKNVDDQTIVIDGGYYRGNFSKYVVRAFHSPIILAFEPDPISFERAKKKFSSDPRIEIVNAALGDQMGQAEFFRGPYPGTNSLFPRPSDGLKPYFPKQAYLEGGTSVEVVTLDHECNTRGIESIDLLKLDLQGGELMALEGAKTLLAAGAIKVILLEAMFVRKYKDQPLLWQIWQFLENFEYTFYALGELKIGPYENDEKGMRQGQWNHCDVIFISNPLRIILDSS